MTTPAGPAAPPESQDGALDRVHQALARAAQGLAVPDPSTPEARQPVRCDEPWHALEHLRTLFGLSAFERDLLVLCAGPSLQSRFISSIAAALNNPSAACPTFGLALAVLDDPHWSAVSPARPLRYWQLLEVDRGSMLHGPLRMDERIFQFLIGVPTIDERLQALGRPIPANPAGGGHITRQPQAVSAGARHWERPAAARAPLLLIGKHRSTRECAFTAICERTGLRPYALDGSDIPTAPAEREELARLLTREAALAGLALYLRTENCYSVQNISAWLELTDAPVAIEVLPGTAAEQLDGVRLHLPAMSADERCQAWANDLGALADRMDGYLDRIAEYFHFDEAAIRLSAAAIRETAAASEGIDLGQLSWRVCREHARRSLETLAQRVDARACWADLVLPAPQVETLRQIAIHMHQRAIVNERWGFAAKHSRGLGLTALFAGTSGTGKTMAAEILATELDLDLYKVDLASVVSKYIGETEKNLRAVFDAAEQSGAILLFDEADALFGKRSEVRDSHDRYANLEISYLLQQMESYRGIAILTTNMQHAIDPAFMRRLRFIVQFPFPDQASRARIWESIFPAATPVGELDFDQLARLNVSGGVIRNIAMHAAFLAADDSMLVEPRHILAAARTEYAKIDKPLTAAETRGME